MPSGHITSSPKGHRKKKETTAKPKAPPSVFKDSKPPANDGTALAKNDQATKENLLRILEIPVVDERKYSKLDLYELARLVASFLIPYPFVRAVYLCPGAEQDRPYNLLFEIPEVPKDMAKLHSQFMDELWDPPEKRLALQRVYRDGRGDASIDWWMWYDVEDVKNIEGERLHGLVLSSESVCLCARDADFERLKVNRASPYPKIISDAPEPISIIRGSGIPFSEFTPHKKNQTIDELLLIRGEELLERWSWYDPMQIIYFVLQGELAMIDSTTGDPSKGGGLTKGYLNWISSRPPDMQRRLFSDLRFRKTDIEEFEKKPAFKKGVHHKPTPIKPIQEPAEKAIQVSKDKPLQPTVGTEEPIVGYKGIARFMKCHPDTVRKKFRPKGLPVRETQSGRVLAYASQINAWLETHTTKNRKKKNSE